MYKFKVGDKITAQVSGRHFEVILPCSNDDGTIGYFSKVTGGGFKGDHTILWGETGLELVKPGPKFKVGDVVWFTVDLGTILIGEITSTGDDFYGVTTYNIKADREDFRYARNGHELTKHNGPVIKVGDYVYSKEYGHGEVTSLSKGFTKTIYAHFNNTNERAEECQVMKAAPKFKVGDRVSWYNKVETIVSIKPSVIEPGGWAYNEEGILEWALKPYVEPVPVEVKRPFKFGDVVVNGFGNKYTVVKVNDDGTIDVSYHPAGYHYPKQREDIFKPYVEPVPAPEPVVEPAKPKFKVGDVVRLKSGGPKMTVSRDNGEIGWFCQWIDDSGHRGATFLPAVIEKVY